MFATGGRLDWLVVPQIPLVDVRAQYAPLLDELKERIAEVLDSGRFILGPNVQAFEEEAAAYLGVRHAIGVANGTDALVLALDAMGVSEGDEVICPAFTFYATAEAIIRRGARPVFADIDPASLNIDPEDAAKRITPRTKAIIPVHLFGRPAALDDLKGLGIPLLEDAAQAFGARDKKRFDLVGYNSRLDEVQAVVLRVFLSKIEEWNRWRREAAGRYAELGLGAACDLPADEPGHVYHMYVVRSPERDRISESLQAADISSAAYYTTPLHLQPALEFLGHREGDFPETERAARENLALPLWAGIGPNVQERVVEVVKKAASLEPVR